MAIVVAVVVWVWVSRRGGAAEEIRRESVSRLGFAALAQAAATLLLGRC